jgi:hypothetical protein
MTDNSKPRLMAICQRSGFKVPRDEMVREWTGLWVHRDFYDPKHPSLDRPAPRGQKVRDRLGVESDRDVGPGEITKDSL